METMLIDEKSSLELRFDQGGEVVVFDETVTDGLSRKVIVSNHTKLCWYGVISGQNTYNLEFVTESGESTIRLLLLAGADKKLETTIYSRLTSSQTITNIHILSLVSDAGIIELNGTVQIHENITKVKGHILEENIFLGSKGNIRGIPSLLVHSDDVEAGHAARIERVSDEKLYYLRARGIPKDDATVMMIESSVAGLIEGLEEQYQEKVLSKVMQLF
ncbi:SufD family Fe-S cluster assembly protein [Candidatus Gracilibacteria bacterium]|nr:SufD family Fe-S cluster assembly protein [Candidatus Gracilibacteria bacterium]